MLTVISTFFIIYLSFAFVWTLCRCSKAPAKANKERRVVIPRVLCLIVINRRIDSIGPINSGQLEGFNLRVNAIFNQDGRNRNFPCVAIAKGDLRHLAGFAVNAASE